MARDRPDRRGPRDDGDQTCRLPQRRRGTGGTGVRETLAADPFSGAVYVFRAKRADRIKLIFWDGTGLCLFATHRSAVVSARGVVRAIIHQSIDRLQGPIAAALQNPAASFSSGRR